jgi:hypothetical protein
MDPDCVSWMMDSTATASVNTSSNSQGQGAGFQFSPPLQLATVLILHACCLEYLELESSNDKRHLGGHGSSRPTSPSKDLASSPFFSLLVVDALETLSSLQKRHPARDRATQEVLDGFYQFVETSLLPSMLGPDRWERARQLHAGSSSTIEDIMGTGPPTERNGTASIISLLQEALAEWIPAASTASDSQSQPLQESTTTANVPATHDYVSPFVWARTESELNDLKRIMENVTATSYHASAGDSSNDALPASALLEPMAGIRAPFARPLPPPLLPLCGCT